MLLGATALQTFAVFGLATGFASPAFAQDAPAPATTESSEPVAVAPDTVPTSEVAAQTGQEPTSGQAITVTGSRIRRPNLESTVPITSISGESLIQGGDTNIGDTLNELPQLRSTFSQQNPGLGIGIAGLNLLDLRGLGTVRTLVLVNGRRHVAADILNNAVSPDVNTIPNDLIERVDIVTGGNSAIYGSDAIAGVVNFVLRRDYQGLQVRGQYGASPRGFGDNYYVSAMYGTNFNEDRGNITLHAEYANQQRIFGSDLPWLDSVNGQIVTDVDPAGLPFGSDGVPDATFQRDVRSRTIHRFGLIPISQSTVDNPLVATDVLAGCGLGLAASNGPPSQTGTPYNCAFIFDEGGNLSPLTGNILGTGPLGSAIGGNGQTGREGRLLSLQPKLQRYNFNILAHYTISDAFEPFLEAKWNRTKVRGNNASPTGIQGTLGAFDARERVRLDNPFLSPAERAQIATLITNSGCNTDLATPCSTTRQAIVGANQGRFGQLNATDLAAIAAGTYRFVIARTLLDVGIRDEIMKRDTYRVVGGFRGTFNDDWTYEVSANWGKYKEKKNTNGFLDKQRFMLAMDAGVNPITGQIQCRAQFDPTAAAAFDSGTAQVGTTSRANAGQAARLAADIAACVPYNPFGAADNSASVDYFQYHAKASASLRQFVLNGFVGGDTSEWFELPGGPIRFALGAEYRREKGDYIDDPYVNEGNPLAPPNVGVDPTTQSNTNAVVIGRFNPPAFIVKEAFGEIQIPIMKDEPFFEEFTVSGAARVSKYNKAAGDVGTVWAYNAGLDWAPVKDIRFRGNYSRSVRAPNLSELYFPPVPNFSPGFLDPCGAAQIANNPNRLANCTADLGPLLAGIRSATISLPVISGSNPDLQEETSDSYTVGAVIQPRWIPGLSVSVDWYKIKVNNVIVALGAQAIANNCYDQPSLNNVFCSLFERNRGTTADPFGQQPGEILGNTLIQAGVNFAARRREGIDVNANYRTNVGDLFRLNTNLIYTHNIQISNFENPALPNFENRILSELGDPKDEFRWDTDLTHGPFTFGYRMRYIGPMFTSLYENFNELPGACTTVCPPNNLDVADPIKYKSVFYHDIRFELELKKLGFGRQFNFYAGVDNLFDKHPPLGLSGTGTSGITDRGTGNAAIYDAKGRMLYAGFKAQF
jgi:outer membrane receptor protein involved in Fe transport